MTARARLQAPRENRAVLADPPLKEAGALIRENQARLDACPCSVLGRPLAEVRQQARRAALDAAGDYLRTAGEPVPEAKCTGTAPRLLVAGHQPELFHPGVWVKNFALHGLAAQHGSAPLNLVVDSDLAKTIDLKIPTLETGDPSSDLPHRVHRLSVPLDLWAREVPFEERRVLDEPLFASLPNRLDSHCATWPFTPFLRSFWNDVIRSSAATSLLGERLAAARRAWERRWGCHNWEVPVSRLCRIEPFAWFACHLLAEAPRFHDIYNACVREYRRVNGIKDHQHPVPDLAAQGDWVEAPFWGWRSPLIKATRGRLMVRRQDHEIALRIDDDVLPSIPIRPGDASRTVAAWQQLERLGWKLRSRALTTTLFARLFLGDLFVHGIGGAKYDEITDAIIRAFYGIEPPRFIVLSATLHLPFPVRPVSKLEVQAERHRLRDLWWNPQRHIREADSTADDVKQLLNEKRRWIGTRAESRRARRERFEQLRSLTAALRPFVAATLEAGRHRADHDFKQLQANEILHRRDYAFCLFPEQMLRPFVTAFLAV